MLRAHPAQDCVGNSDGAIVGLLEGTAVVPFVWSPGNGLLVGVAVIGDVVGCPVGSTVGSDVGE